MFKIPLNTGTTLLNLLIAISLLVVLSWTGCKDSCEGVVCANGGSCVGGKCDCSEGTYGDDCSLLYRDAFVGNYDVTEMCGQGNYSYVMSIAADPDNITRVLIQNLGDFGLNYTATASSSGISFNETKQGLTLNGTGTLNGTVLSIQFSSSGNFVDNCNSTATKR